MELQEIKSLIEDQGKAFDAFKATHDEEMAEVKKQGAADPVLTERMEKIEKSLDVAVEAKAAVELKIEAERKEREELEIKFNRAGLSGNEADAKAQIELKEFNTVCASVAAERKKMFTPLDMEGYRQYKDICEKWMREGKDALDPDEVKTMSVGSDPDGGYFVTPDVTGRMVKKIYETSPMRQICSVQPISTDALEGIEDLDEAGAGYAGEKNTSGNTTTPGVGKWRIPVWWIDTEPKATQQLLDDSAVDIEAWLGEKVGNKLGRFENSEFVGGAQDKIRGIVSYPTAVDNGSGVAWGKFGHVKTGANGAFPAADPGDIILDFVGAPKEAYLGNARFLTKRTIITQVRKFKGSDGHYLWMPSLAVGQPETLVGFPITRAEDMPAAATGSLSMAFGDFREAYQIVDRQGVRVLRDPYTEKPFIKFYTTRRTGGGALNFEAVKFLKFSA